MCLQLRIIKHSKPYQTRLVAFHAQIAYTDFSDNIFLVSGHIEEIFIGSHWFLMTRKPIKFQKATTD